MPIEISQIRPYKGSVEEAFEELICQILRRTQTRENPTWRRLHGAGGDGGVEALWLEGNSKNGMQAKWFLKTSDIGWAQIEKSFKTAITIHPDLSDYHIYLACDLTGPTGRKTKKNTPAQSGVQKWTDFETKLLSYAKSQSINIEIHLHTLSDVLTEISKPECAGLTEFWFSEIELSKSVLENWYKTAEHDLAERYSVVDNVEVSASSSFDGLVRDNFFQQKISNIQNRYISCAPLKAPDFLPTQLNSVSVNVENLLNDLITFVGTLQRSLDEGIPYTELRGRLRNTQEAFQRVQRVYWDIDKKEFSDNQKKYRV